MCVIVPTRELRRSFTRQTKKCTIDPKDVHKIIWVDDDDDDVLDDRSSALQPKVGDDRGWGGRKNRDGQVSMSCCGKHVASGSML